MSTEDAIPLQQRAFQAALRELVASFDRSDHNPGSYQTSSSAGCVDSMFTQSSQRCYRCTYCESCTDCSRATHCRDCQHCHNCSYCVQSNNLVGCSYVVLSESCYDCIFCFGCVGLVNREFHILNQPFSKDEYFRLLEKLEPLFGLKSRRR